MAVDSGMLLLEPSLYVINTRDRKCVVNSAQGGMLRPSQRTGIEDWRLLKKYHIQPEKIARAVIAAYAASYKHVLVYQSPH